MTDHDRSKSIVSSSLCWLRRNKSGATKWCDCAGPQDCSNGMELFGDEAGAAPAALSSAGRLVGEGQVCVACGKPWDGEKCGAAENGWPHAVCEPVASAPHTAPATMDEIFGLGWETRRDAPHTAPDATDWKALCGAAVMERDIARADVTRAVGHLLSHEEMKECPGPIECSVGHYRLKQELAAAQAENEKLKAALETAKSWLETWAAHVRKCRGGNVCTCGLTAVRYEISAAISPLSPEKL